MKAPTNKRENYELYEAGFYGNHLKFWTHIDELLDDLKSGKWPADKPYAFRLSNVPGTRPFRYCTPLFGYDQAIELSRAWSCMGIPRADICPNEVGQDNLIIAQGEIQRSQNFYDLRYTYFKGIMSTAWVTGEALHESGFRALNLIKQWMDASSYDNLQRLFDTFEDYPVIEFSSYSRSVGVLKQNTVIWEVRNY